MNVTTHKIIRPISTYFRRRRMKTFTEMFVIDSETDIIDVGGEEFNWKLIPNESKILLVNINGDTFERGNIKKVQGDGRQLAYPDKSFDIAYSNSVIEHVGTWEDQLAFAAEIRRLAPRYYVQTPNKWFFIEPHMMAAFLHFLPHGLERRLVPYLSVWGLLARPSLEEVDHFLGMTVLLDSTQMKTLFPDAQIVEERFLGFTKSIIAFKL